MRGEARSGRREGGAAVAAQAACKREGQTGGLGRRKLAERT